MLSLLTRLLEYEGGFHSGLWSGIIQQIAKKETLLPQIYMQGNKNISLFPSEPAATTFFCWMQETKVTFCLCDLKTQRMCALCLLNLWHPLIIWRSRTVVQYRNDTSRRWIPCTAAARLLTTDLLWKLSKVSGVVLVLVVDDMPVWLVGLNALRRQYKQITDHYNILLSESVEEHS